jgi:UDPglucose 6-dehydrogenase
MKITVLGLWHLGCVTAACCARHFQVVGLDANVEVVAELGHGRAPLFEPGLDGLLAEGLQKGSLSFTTDPALACREADVLWVCGDTPVNEADISDVEAVLRPVRAALAHLAAGTLVLISSQLPVGTCAALEKEFPAFEFASCPENLRLGAALKVFMEADRVVLGIRPEKSRALLEELFAPFT